MLPSCPKSNQLEDLLKLLKSESLLRVKNIPEDIAERDVLETFAEFGNIVSMQKVQKGSFEIAYGEVQAACEAELCLHNVCLFDPAKPLVCKAISVPDLCELSPLAKEKRISGKTPEPEPKDVKMNEKTSRQIEQGKRKNDHETNMKEKLDQELDEYMALRPRENSKTKPSGAKSMSEPKRKTWQPKHRIVFDL